MASRRPSPGSALPPHNATRCRDVTLPVAGGRGGPGNRGRAAPLGPRAARVGLRAGGSGPPRRGCGPGPAAAGHTGAGRGATRGPPWAAPRGRGCRRPRAPGGCPSPRAGAEGRPARRVSSPRGRLPPSRIENNVCCVQTLSPCVSCARLNLSPAPPKERVLRRCTKAGGLPPGKPTALGRGPGPHALPPSVTGRWALGSSRVRAQGTCWALA